MNPALPRKPAGMDRMNEDKDRRTGGGFYE
jgi:hypothetical protein